MVKSILKMNTEMLTSLNFIGSDYIYNKKDADQYGGVCPSIHGPNG